MADTKTSDETAAAAFDGTELVRVVQGGGNKKATVAQFKAYGVGWTLVSSTSPSGAASVDVNNLAGYNEVLIIARALTASISGARAVQVSVDNGSTFDTTVANHQQISTAGVESNAASAAIGYHGTNSASARTLVTHIRNLKGAVKSANSLGNPDILYVGGAGADINAIRVLNSTGGTISGGPVYVFAR
jgi:hypothetical protein